MTRVKGGTVVRKEYNISICSHLIFRKQKPKKIIMKSLKEGEKRKEKGMCMTLKDS